MKKSKKSGEKVVRKPLKLKLSGVSSERKVAPHLYDSIDGSPTLKGCVR